MKYPQPTLVATSEALNDCCRQCQAAEAIALDTEFVRTNTFYARLGLIQIYDGETIWLVDAPAVDDFSALIELFQNRSVTKVLHSASEDLEVFGQLLGVLPQPLFDTQIAVAFLGLGYSKGYSAVVGELLGVQLDKHETRSDWLRRPLTESQQHYAAEDVFFLLEVYRLVRTGLEESGKLAWMEEDMIDTLRSAAVPESPEDYYRRVKGAWRLSASDMALLRRLTTWRELEAREKDRPRNHIVPDQVLLDFIQLKPTTINRLHGIDGFHSGAIRRYGETLMSLLREAPQLEVVEPPPPPLDREARKLLGSCRQQLGECAEEHHMAAELLARKKELEALVRSRLEGRVALSGRLAQGWRKDIIGEDLYDHVAKTTL